MNIYNNKYFSQVEGISNPLEQKWKFEKISPALIEFLNKTKLSKVKLIEIGAGSGFFIKNLRGYFKKNGFFPTVLEINKYSVKYLEKILPKKNIVIGDISQETNFKDKSFDLCVGIDVLEHIDNLENAVREIRRISKYAIFKIPIEKSLAIRLVNTLTAGKYRKNIIARIGHIHWFSKDEIRLFFENKFEKVEYSEYANIGLYQYKKNLMAKSPKRVLLIIWYFLSALLFRISPCANATVFGDHLIILVKC
jgi:SAM-dependent methyltransferase